MKKRSRWATRLRRTERAAIAVEFVVAIVPILTTFFALCQIAALAYQSLLVKHAAFVASRAAAVITPQACGSGPPSDVTAAAQLVLARVNGLVSVESTQVDPMSQEMSNTTVTFIVPCTVPLARNFVCGFAGIHVFTASASFPNQGTYMQSVWPPQCN